MIVKNIFLDGKKFDRSVQKQYKATVNKEIDLIDHLERSSFLSPVRVKAGDIADVDQLVEGYYHVKINGQSGWIEPENLPSLGLSEIGGGK